MQRTTFRDLPAPASPGTEGDPASCLVCGSDEVEMFLDLGVTALANKFLTAAEIARPEARYPLRVGFCQGCGHVQLTETVPPDAMFTDYLYVSAAGPDDLVIDIGCNDASLLGSFAKFGVRTLGVDPAENLAERARETGIERYVGFFGADTAGEIVDRWGSAALITATNTFPHIPDLEGFLKGIEMALEPGGRFVVEAHYLVDLFDQLAFDTVYHEHVSYWALGPMCHLFERHGLQVVDAERLPIHHGQLRVTVQRQGEGTVSASVDGILEMERERGIGELGTWQAFADRVLKIKQDLLGTLQELKANGCRLAGYGAPAKGSTLLEFLEIGPELLDFIADRSALKQGRYTPGSHIPIVPPERLLEDRPDYVLLLAWNFVDEILAQQRAYREAGGKFIIPVPSVQIV
jgi:SAM-dependent methyltransferase